MITDQAVNGLWAVLLVGSIIVSAPLAKRMNDKLMKTKPQPQPYIWGYLLGFIGIVSYGGVALFALAYPLFATDVGLLEGFIAALLTAPFVIPYIYAIKRKRWALRIPVHAGHRFRSMPVHRSG